jgi:hypothetical protein
MSQAQLSWSRAHATAGNEGLIDLSTTPAGRGSVSIPEIGTFAPSVCPVTAPDGTVFIGNADGKVFGFRADGTLLWSRDTGNTGTIAASPAVTSDGGVFVVTTRILRRDHRPGAPSSGIRPESYLHRFSTGGGWSGPQPFPTRDGITGYTGAPFNIWREGGNEVLMVPVVYRVLSTTEVWILAFASTGGFLGDAMVTRTQDEITGVGVKPDWFPPAEYKHGVLLEPTGFPSIAIFKNPQGGTPLIMVSDRLHSLVGYTFATDGTKGQFHEEFRVKDKQLFFTPMVMFDGHTRIGTSDGRIVVTKPNAVTVPPIKLGTGAVYAPLTRTADGRLIAVHGSEMVVLRGNAVESRRRLPGYSLVRAAASHTHFFVAATDALVTFDANTMAEVMRFPWTGGGIWPPVIGPQGHVYAMANNVLFVFRPR